MSLRSASVFLFVFCLLLLCTAPLCADTITFDSVHSELYDYGAITQGYAGFQWYNIGVFYSTGCADITWGYMSTGYCRFSDATGLKQMAYMVGDYGKTDIGKISSGTPFTLNSGLFAAAWNNDIVTTVTGYRNGKAVGQATLFLNSGFDDCKYNPTTCVKIDEPFPFDVEFGWHDIDEVTFHAVGGHSNGVGSVLFPDHYQANFIIGELNVTRHEAPEPATTVLVVGGLAGLWLGRSKRFPHSR
jgi:uncharacterized protein (DUF779 family)